MSYTPVVKKADIKKLLKTIEARDPYEYIWEFIDFSWRKVNELEKTMKTKKDHALELQLMKMYHTGLRDLSAIVAGQMDTRTFADQELKEFFEKKKDSNDKVERNL